MAESIATTVDRVYKMRAERLKLKKQYEHLQEQENALKERVIQRILRGKATSISGQNATGSVYSMYFPIMRDYETFIRYALFGDQKNTNAAPNKREWTSIWKRIQAAGNIDLLPGSPALGAWRERKDSGILVPGTDVDRQNKLSLTKKSTRK